MASARPKPDEEDAPRLSIGEKIIAYVVLNNILDVVLDTRGKDPEAHFHWAANAAEQLDTLVREEYDPNDFVPDEDLPQE